MTPKSILIDAIDPANAILDAKCGVKSDNRARVLMLAIAGQESEWAARRQRGGPARSFWQFEGGPMSGCAQVFKHAGPQIRAVCDELYIRGEQGVVFEAMAWNDVLAAAMARLLLWTDPAPLPEFGNARDGWNYYQRNWRPGAPHPDVWPGRYGTAMGQVQ